MQLPGGYRLISQLGGDAFLAQSPVGERVVLRTLVPGSYDRAGLEWVLSAARAVDPSYTAAVLGWDLAGPQPYLVTEFVDGPTLATLVGSRGPLPGPEVTRLAIGTMTALTGVHERGLTHGGPHPGTVVMGPEGPRLTGLDAARTGTDTSADMLQWARTILFAAGTADPAALPEPVRTVVAGCLAPDPRWRPASGQALLDLLRPPPLTGPGPYDQTAARSFRRAPLLIGGAVLLVLAVTTAVVVLTTGSSAPPDVRRSPGALPAAAVPSAATAASPVAATPTRVWFGKLGLTLPAGWSATARRVLTDPGACDNPDENYFGAKCAGFWVLGPDAIAGGAEGQNPYTGAQPYYPASDVEPCPAPQTGTQLSPAKPATTSGAQVGTGHVAQYTEWHIDCMGAGGAKSGQFTQREWLLPVSKILIVDQRDTPGLPDILRSAVWK